MPPSPEHALPLGAIYAVFSTREQAILARRTAAEALSTAAEALILEPDQLYQLELTEEDKFYPASKHVPRPLTAVHYGKLALAQDIAPPMHLQYHDGRNNFAMYPLVPLQPNRLNKQRGTGMAIALGMTAFESGRLTVITRAQAKQLVATGNVFNPTDITSLR